jgi:hypothetical protein
MGVLIYHFVTILILFYLWIPILFESYFILLLLFFLTCQHKRRERGIRICDLRFIRRGLQPIELSFEEYNNVIVISMHDIY